MKFVKTSHIATESVQDIKDAFERYEPDIVAIEIDAQRLQALRMNQRSFSPLLIQDIGVTGYIFMLLGSYLQEKLGDAVGMQPGEEMLTAYEHAETHGTRVSFIDQPVQRTMQQISGIAFSEKLRLVWELFRGFFVSRPLDFDLTKVPDKQLVGRLKNQLHHKFPQLYQALILERNYVMAENLRNLRATFPDATILVVIGAGHAEVEKLL